MTPHQIDLVVDSFAELRRQREDAGMAFYARLFAIAPELRVLFRIDIEVQARKLMDTLGAAIGSLRDGPAVQDELARLGARHRGYGVRPQHYHLVGEALIATLAAALGARFDAATREAWTTLYREVATAMLADPAPALGRAAGAAAIAG